MRRAVYLALATLAGGCNGGGDPSLSRADATAESTESETSTASDATSSASDEPELPSPDTPIVDLAGVTTVPAPLGDGAKIAARTWVTHIHAKPSRGSTKIGTLRAGAIVLAGEGKADKSDGCDGGWRRIEPAGFVCMSDATENLDDDIVRAASRRPDFAHRLPYMYGTVTRGGPEYARVPTKEQLAEHEPNLKRHLDKWRRDDESGATYGLDVWLRYTEGRAVPSALEALEAETSDADIPWFVAEHRRVPDLTRDVALAGADAVKIGQVDRRQGRSFVHSFLVEGRRYNVTPNLTVVPADRFRPIRGSAFHGWKVDDELTLPFALIRRPGAKKWRWQSDNKRMVSSGKLDWRSAVALTGKQQIYDGKLHYETSEGFYVDDRHASRVDPAKRWPKWAKQGQKWIDINVTSQVLVAYEGQKMVYATLVSTGEAGLDNPDESTATKRGIFRIHTKYASTTMDSEVVGEEFELRDVPYVQYFEGGYALHGAYWHDGFGRPKSHGCINLAPDDARRLFFWTEPALPPGWHSVHKSLTGTVVFVHP